ncbi:isopeptide-forming domain-containing fimbrial protein [Bifidobacterium sp. ESL0704]|uniref:isopeptide-forming domain-containing fimbrial protein n=1 Tax=Bifidobacterium sp. ESL0704 TaxID=2983219 RepID=UPI0023F78597|nr:isopeptide-forming domain-containing fimbrial protein [Bifidobacterium sp. ESL0704]WEV52887.1 isopeptide-forming domain-containing fimbrial protein [Bifidobacterium sp. ESL0704]
MTKFNIRTLAGVAVSAATLLALAPLGVANAANDTIDLSKAQSETITVNSPEAKLKGHKFAAVKIGDYQNASGDADTGTLSSVSVGTTSTLKAAAKQALTDAKTAIGVSTAEDSAYVDNPVGEVASKWLGYGTSGDDTTSNTATAVDPSKHGYDGNLRTFVTELSDNATFKSEIGASNSTVAEDNKTATLSVSHPGMYIVEDVTSDFSSAAVGTSRKASIPMLVSTGITIKNGNDTVVYNKLGDLALNQVNMKSDSPTVKKVLDGTNNDPSIGGTLHYKLTSAVPLTTGFKHYIFTMIDQPSQTGLDYNNDAIVTVGGTKLTKGTDYTVDTSQTYADGSIKYVVFDLSPSIRSLKYQDAIVITYSMKVNDNAQGGTLKNGVKLGYSNDSSKQPSTDKAVIGTDGDGKGEVTDCATATDTTKCSNGSISNDGSDSGDTSATIYFRHFDLINLKKADSTGLAGAEFKVTDNATKKVVKFNKLDDGSYKKAAKQDSEDAVENLAVHSEASAPSTHSGDDKAQHPGELRVDGLKEGDYTVTEVKAAPGFSSTFLPSTVVTLKGNATTPATDAYTNTKDAVFGLIDAQPTLTDVAMSTDKGAILVKNVNSVSQLPLTGGAGVVLALLVVVALAGATSLLIVTRRKLSA